MKNILFLFCLFAISASAGAQKNEIVIGETVNIHSKILEAYMKAGNKELAIINYEKSQMLNPVNRNAEKMLKQLEEQDE